MMEVGMSRKVDEDGVVHYGPLPVPRWPNVMPCERCGREFMLRRGLTHDGRLICGECRSASPIRIGAVFE